MLYSQSATASQASYKEYAMTNILLLICCNQYAILAERWHPPALRPRRRAGRLLAHEPRPTGGEALDVYRSYGVHSYGLYGMVMAYIAMADIVMAYIVMANIVVADTKRCLGRLSQLWPM